MRKTDQTEHAEPVSVLLVDDDSFMRHALRVSLSTRGYVVEEAESGEEGIRMVSEKIIDLVLLDVNMPGMGGVEACQSIRNLRPGLGILMLTVRDSEEIIVRRWRPAPTITSPSLFDLANWWRACAPWNAACARKRRRRWTFSASASWKWT